MGKKYIIIGKGGSNTINGPGLIIKGLISNFNSSEYELVPILLDDDTNRNKFIKKVKKEIRSSKDGIINVHTDGYLIPFYVYIVSIFDKKNKYFLTIHGIRKIEAKYNTKRNEFLYNILERILYKRFENVICVSEMEAKDVRTLYKRKKKVYVIPNATDATSNCKPQKTNINNIKLILLGGLKKGKGIKEALKLFEFLNKVGFNFQANIYGEDEGKLSAFEKEIQNKNLSENVFYRGIQRNKQILYDEIAISDFCVNLSLYDTFNSAIAESLVLGCPCICSNKCGASYLIKQGESGIVVDLTSSDWMQQVSKYIKSFFDNTSKRDRIYEERMEYKDELSWRRIVEKYIALGEIKQ